MAKFYLQNVHPHPASNPAKHQFKEKILSLSNVEKLLGVYEFVTGQNYLICCKSIDLCLIQSLKWSDFWDIISELHIEVSVFLSRNNFTR